MKQKLGDKRIEVEARRLRSASPQFVPLRTPLTSTDWDGDAYSTTAATTLDLSAVFGAPEGIKAVLLRVEANDSGSAANNCNLRVSPDGGNGWALVVHAGEVNDRPHSHTGICPCDANGDIEYAISASGASTLDAKIQIWGYWL